MLVKFGELVLRLMQLFNGATFNIRQFVYTANSRIYQDWQLYLQFLLCVVEIHSHIEFFRAHGHFGESRKKMIFNKWKVYNVHGTFNNHRTERQYSLISSTFRNTSSTVIYTNLCNIELNLWIIYIYTIHIHARLFEAECSFRLHFKNRNCVYARFVFHSSRCCYLSFCPILLSHLLPNKPTE